MPTRRELNVQICMSTCVASKKHGRVNRLMTCVAVRINAATVISALTNWTKPSITAEDLQIAYLCRENSYIELTSGLWSTWNAF